MLRPATLFVGVSIAVETELAARFPASTRASILSDMGVDPAPAPWLDPAVGDVETPIIASQGAAWARGH